MIDPELAAKATPLLSTAIAELFEDEHLEMVTATPAGVRAAHAAKLAALGRDVTALALALEVLLRRSAVEDAGEAA